MFFFFNESGSMWHLCPWWSFFLLLVNYLDNLFVTRRSLGLLIKTVAIVSGESQSVIVQYKCWELGSDDCLLQKCGVTRGWGCLQSVWWPWEVEIKSLSTVGLPRICDCSHVLPPPPPPHKRKEGGGGGKGQLQPALDVKNYIEEVMQSSLQPPKNLK